MTKDEMKNKISLALKDPILQQGFEIICKNLTELEKENKTISRKANEAIADKLLITAKYNEVLNDLNQENDKLQKENAELKNRNRELLESCEGATMMYKDLCKAQELLKQFLNAKNGEDTYKAEWEAEQFFNSDKTREEKEERKYYCKTCIDLICPYSGTERYEINCSGVEED